MSGLAEPNDVIANQQPASSVDIQAPQQDLSGLLAGAMGESAGRQASSESILNTPAGFGDMVVTSGTSPDWPTDVRP
jgi:hypothetical protein